MESEAHAYSVWGLPPEDVRIRLKKLMDGLRSEFGGPELEPHITVVKAVPLLPDDTIHKFKLACEGVKAYDIHAKGISTGSCLSIQFDPTHEVAAISDHCYGHFGFHPSLPYKPHMSLLYADLSDEEMKKAEERANVLDNSIADLCFTINRFALYLTDEDKTLKSWRKIAEFELLPSV